MDTMTYVGTRCGQTTLVELRNLLNILKVIEKPVLVIGSKQLYSPFILINYEKNTIRYTKFISCLL